MKILTLGGATQDVFIQQEAIESIELVHNDVKKTFLLLQEGSKIDIDSLQYATGGGATNAAVAFSRLGCNVSCICKVGNDEAGKQVLDELKKEKIAIHSCLMDVQKYTGISYIIPSQNAERTVLAYRGANMFLSAGDIPYDTFHNYSYIYLSSLSGNSSQLLESIAKTAFAQRCSVVVNPGMNQLIQEGSSFFNSLPYIDILIFNKKEAEQCFRLLTKYVSHNQMLLTTLGTGCAGTLLQEFSLLNHQVVTILDFFKAISQKGPKTIVVTNGKDGVYVYHDTIMYYHPSLPVNCVSTLGAGDAFSAAFVAGLGFKRSVEDSIRMGILNSAAVIQYLDAKKGLLHKDAIESLLQELDPNLLKKYKHNEN